MTATVGPSPPPAAHWRRARRLVGRIGWGVADQAASSLTNFIVGIYVARTLGPRGFGAFSLAFATYLLVLAASRGLSTNALGVRFSGVDTASWRRAVGKASGLSTALGVVAGLACAVLGAFLGGSTGAAFLALALALPGLMLQDSWRFAFFAAGRGAQAFINDIAWAVALTLMLVTVSLAGSPDVAMFMLVWGASATVAAVAGAAQARILPRPSQALVWVREQRDLAFHYLGEELSLTGATQLRFYGLAALAGLTAVGSLRTAELLMGPFSMIIMGMAMMAVPEASRVLRGSTRMLRPFCLLLGGIGALGAAMWGLTLGLVLPGGLGEWLLGASYAPASGLILPTTITIAAIGASLGATSGLHALGAASRSLLAQVIRSVLYLGTALGGAVVAGAEGAAWGSAIGCTTGALVWWWQFHLGLRDRRARDADSAPGHASEA